MQKQITYVLLISVQGDDDPCVGQDVDHVTIVVE